DDTDAVLAAFAGLLGSYSRLSGPAKCALISLVANWPGFGIGALGQGVLVAFNTMRHHAERLEPILKGQQEQDSERNAEIIALHERGRSAGEIAQKMRLSKSVVKGVIRRHAKRRAG